MESPKVWVDSNSYFFLHWGDDYRNIISEGGKGEEKEWIRQKGGLLKRVREVRGADKLYIDSGKKEILKKGVGGGGIIFKYGKKGEKCGGAHLFELNLRAQSVR